MGELKNFNKELCDTDYNFLSYLFAEVQDKCIELFKQKNTRYEASFFKPVSYTHLTLPTSVKMMDFCLPLYDLKTR